MYDELVYKINGCLFAVYNKLKSFWKEEVYEKALMLEFEAQGLAAEQQKEFRVFYFDEQVGLYRIDVLVEDTIVLELKAAPDVFPLHKAQLISYLKGYDKPLGILANFGGAEFYYRIFPNKVSQLTALQDQFDFEKITIPGKETLKPLFEMANRILMTLGPGYFHQVYRRAFYYELRNSGTEFELIKEMVAEYRKNILDSKEVYFFRIGDLLLSAIAVIEFTDVTLTRFRQYVRYFQSRRGLIFNFRALCLDYRYVDLLESRVNRNKGNYRNLG